MMATQLVFLLAASLSVLQVLCHVTPEGEVKTFSFFEFPASCVSLAGVDLDEAVTSSILDLDLCKKQCAHMERCLAVQWYGQPWGNKQCHLVFDRGGAGEAAAAVTGLLEVGGAAQKWIS